SSSSATSTSRVTGLPPPLVGLVEAQPVPGRGGVVVVVTPVPPAARLPYRLAPLGVPGRRVGGGRQRPRLAPPGHGVVLPGAAEVPLPPYRGPPVLDAQLRAGLAGAHRGAPFPHTQLLGAVVLVVGGPALPAEVGHRPVGRTVPVGTAPPALLALPGRGLPVVGLRFPGP